MFRSKWMALGWLLIISVLFFIPGSSLPKETWFSKIYIDKWVHVGLFAGLVFLWRSAFTFPQKNGNLLLLAAAFIYGLAVELIQGQWVPRRDFDLVDLLSDAVGSILGLFLWLRVYKKNKPL
jgi:VanZ family protein